MTTNNIIISTYTFSLKDIVYCICTIIDDPDLLCKLAQVNKLFNKVVINLPYYKLCKIIYTENNQFWTNIIKYDNLRLLKVLVLKINKENLNNMFIDSCQYGHLEIAKWLINYAKSINSLIDIHINNESAFQWAYGVMVT